GEIHQRALHQIEQRYDRYVSYKQKDQQRFHQRHGARDSTAQSRLLPRSAGGFASAAMLAGALGDSPCASLAGTRHDFGWDLEASTLPIGSRIGGATCMGVAGRGATLRPRVVVAAPSAAGRNGAPSASALP